MAGEFAIRVDSLDELFNEFEAGALETRSLRYEVRDYLLDCWEDVREDPPSRLVVRASEARDPARADAVAAAIGHDLRSAARPLWFADPLSRRERVAARIGIVFLFICIVVSSGLDRISENVIVEGISQGILVVGWVALWLPADRFVTQVVPHFFNRRRYAEFAGIEVAFEWS